MTALFDRRRVNGPEDTFLPLHNVDVRGDEVGDAPVWTLDEHRLLVDPVSIPADELALTSMTIGDDALSVPRIARRAFSRTEGRGDMDSRPMCTCVC